MENFSVENEMGNQELASPRTTTRRRKGGLITMPFIIANEAFEKVASYGLLPNMIFYLMKGYGMSVTKGTNLLFFWSAATNFTPTVGAFLADSYLGRFLTIALGSLITFLGMIILWLTAMLPKLRPPACNLLNPPCKSASSSQYGVLISAFTLMSIGAGGIRSSSLAFGADQLDKRDDPNNKRVLESFFGWYYVSATVSVLIAVTGIVYIQEHNGYKIGFGIPAILMFFSAFLFLLASRFYIKQPVTRSLFTGLAQVTVVAFKNRKLALPPSNSAWYHSQKGSEYTVPSKRLRFLNKACIIRNPEDVKSDGVAANPWNLCTVEQVEELKTLIRVIPIWSTGIMLSINTSQTTFPVLQASSMDRHFTSGFQIPAGSYSVFLLISLTGWIFIYDRILLPLASKIRGKPVRISTKVRMGIGLFISCISMVVAGTVEYYRRKKAIKQGFLNNPQAILDMSAMWLVPQYLLFGLADAFNAIGQTEFYYSEFPKTMSSIGSSLFGLGMAVANLLASLILSIVDKCTKGGEDKESWVSGNINKAHYHYYYWLLAILSGINFLYFLFCSWAYGPCVDRFSESAVEEDHHQQQEGENLFKPGTPIRVFSSA